MTGTMEAATKGDIFAQLDNMGLFPVSAKESGTSTLGLNNMLLKFQRVKDDDLIFFTRQLQTVIRSGMPLVRGLRALEEQTSNERLRATIKDIIQDIDNGRSLSDAFSKHKGVFSETYIGMVRAGEIGGNIEEVLRRISDLTEFQMKTREIVKSAIRYPIFVLATLAIAFVVLIKMVVPKFAPIFRSSNVALPLPTQILLLINDLLQNYGLVVLGTILLIFFGFVYYKRTKNGALTIDKLMLSVPLIGPIIQKTSMSRFAFIIQNLIEVGVPIIPTLDIASRAVGNTYIAGKIREVTESVEKGRGISMPLKKAGIFPPLLVHLIATGEETGSLEEMLREISVHYDREVNYSVGRLSAWIEPLLTVFLAGMVLLLALAIFMPWWNMMNVMRGGG